MGGDRDDLIPSVFVGKRSGERIKSTYNYTSTQFVVKLTDDTPFDINNYLLPFAIVVGICFIIMLAIMIFKCVQVIITFLIVTTSFILISRIVAASTATAFPSPR